MLGSRFVVPPRSSHPDQEDPSKLLYHSWESSPSTITPKVDPDVAAAGRSLASPPELLQDVSQQFWQLEVPIFVFLYYSIIKATDD